MKNKNRSDYFEGWYLKHTMDDIVFAFIISFHEPVGEPNYACIQFITPHASFSQQYPMSKCIARLDCFDVRIDGNRFSNTGIKANLDFDGYHINCDIKYGDFTTLENHIMGPFRHLPNMQCSHDVLSLSHQLGGHIDFDGTYRSLSNGVGYIEKDSGNSFPETYIWSQTNFFHEDQGSIVVAGASIPYAGIEFKGVICEILYHRRHYRIATYKGGRILDMGERGVTVRQGSLSLRLDVLEQEGQLLDAPIKGSMNRRINESIKCKIRYRFYMRGRKIFDFISDSASFEYDEIGV